jgi:hypothetical protein
MPRVPGVLTLASVQDWIDHLIRALSLPDLACVLGALLIIRVSRYAGMWIYALVGLPGTFAHELAHYVVALILGARPSLPKLIPQRTERGWLLGSVPFRGGYVRALPIALAPLALAPLALWWAGTFLHSASWPLYCVHVWIVAALVTACLPSRTDLKLALPALIVVAAIVIGTWILR